MFFTSKKQHLVEKTREINISEDSKLPQLYRLCSDFGFAVLGLCKDSATPKKYVLCEVGLVKGDHYESEKVTPEFDSLSELESYTENNVVDIVQKYLFGSDDMFSESHSSVA